MGETGLRGVGTDTTDLNLQDRKTVVGRFTTVRKRKGEEETTGVRCLIMCFGKSLLGNRKDSRPGVGVRVQWRMSIDLQRRIPSSPLETLSKTGHLLRRYQRRDTYCFLWIRVKWTMNSVNKRSARSSSTSDGWVHLDTQTSFLSSIFFNVSRGGREVLEDHRRS